MTPRIVLDTNVYVSATLSRGKPYNVLRAAEKGDAELYTSPFIFGEIEDVLGRDKIPFDDAHAERFVDKVLSISTVVSPDDVPDVIKKDSSDNRILACAVEADADYVVSGDSHLLNISEYEDIDIVTPAQFARKLR